MHTEEEIQRAAKLAEEFDPAGVPIDDTTDLRTLAEAVDAVRAGEARVRELVARARANGRSWGESGSRSAYLARQPASVSPRRSALGSASVGS